MFGSGKKLTEASKLAMPLHHPFSPYQAVYGKETGAKTNKPKRIFHESYERDEHGAIKYPQDSSIIHLFNTLNSFFDVLYIKKILRKFVKETKAK